MDTLIKALTARVLEVADQKSLQIKKISKGLRFTGTILEDGSCGMCFSVFNQESLDSHKYIKNVKSPKNLDIIKLLQFVENLENNLERIIGISVLNAVSQHILKQEMKNYYVTFDTHPIEHIQFKMTDRVVMIGAIRSFLPKLHELVNNFVVIDNRFNDNNFPNVKNPETTKEQLHQADIVFITGSALANNTLESLLKEIKVAKEIAVVGPTAGFLPEPLFDRGVTILSSMQALQPDKVLQIISENGGTPHFKKYCKKYNIIHQKF
ncbi:MAG: Rossmann-like domain-containing protein [Promethearchaeota archaeon]